ncbi:15202_t:CDS:2 [Cetraspora pellucida]|uniref:15202_t:CDS:1 n=1 Tax=Cetraspora pellucida TaxID=1433469 RepID=A0A9N9F455_9GLOM|nr:15202_t:CDS:2 [Cetraspora pellucida]
MACILIKLTVSQVFTPMCNMDFFKTDVDEWTCENVRKYYRKNNVNQILDTINKDLKRISKSGSDATRWSMVKPYTLGRSVMNSWFVPTLILAEAEQLLVVDYELLVPAKPYTLGRSKWTKDEKTLYQIGLVSDSQPLGTMIENSPPDSD